MRLTNKEGLPEALVAALLNDPYDPGVCDISVTRLIGPPQIRVLRNQHDADIEEDVIDRIWALLGQAVHVILERAEVEGIAEKRLYKEVDGWKVSGQFDRLAYTPGGVLQDYKVTSAWTAIHGPKPEWINQLNCLAVLCENSGYSISKLEVVAIYRDWNRRAAISSVDYPKQQVQRVVVPLWNKVTAQNYLRQRVHVHQLADEGEIIPCSDEERWYRGEKWALMKKGRKSAVRLFDTEDNAQDYLECLQKDQKIHYVEHRPGTYNRCEAYCEVAGFCPQWAAQG